MQALIFNSKVLGQALQCPWASMRYAAMQQTSGALWRDFKDVYSIGLSVYVPSYLSGFRPSSARMRFVSSMLTSSPFFFSFLPPRSRSSSLCRFLSSLSLCLRCGARQYHGRLGSEKLPRVI